ncbi:hypothetical protein I5192_06915 [Ruegeria sp. SCSIO 43209]|uniref:rolling circle replication-associated protein n=1 Tax=Ruegeria sp. SCSIO 43209 TaxID=2793010 RepID=UPI001CA86178|nr:hypothetical protein [Ruegeria sp. SCSIO 43209]UAB90386.1 hypothetical protein I5192_06915 [Ruegeria sp. SCSIO 43209]
MAEKTVVAETLVINLTYRNNADGTLPPRAKAFHYSDVQAFLKSLREEYYRTYTTRGEISYVVAGERGSKRGRVHWHMIIFGERPFKHLGVWKDENNDKVIPGNRPGRKPNSKEYYRDHWQYWPHGHVTTDNPDQGTLAYVLKYALKDQFNVVNSKGTMREAKSENDGASYFRMSKVPPIGFRWLERKCEEWERKLIVPVTLNLNVPDYSGYWYPKGKQREYLLNRLHHINKLRNQKYGQDCPQWNALLASVSVVEKDWEGLIYGEIEEYEQEYDERAWQEKLGHWKAKIRKRCGGIYPCRKCYRGLNAEAKDGLKAADYIARYSYQEKRAKGERRSYEDWWRSLDICNYHCAYKNDDAHKETFGA